MQEFLLRISKADFAALERYARQRKTAAGAMLAEAIGDAIFRLVEDPARNAWLDQLALELANDPARAEPDEKAVARELALMAKRAGVSGPRRPVINLPDRQTTAQRRKRRAQRGRGVPAASWNTGVPTSDQTAPAAPAAGPSTGSIGP